RPRHANWERYLVDAGVPRWPLARINARPRPLVNVEDGAFSNRARTLNKREGLSDRDVGKFCRRSNLDIDLDRLTRRNGTDVFKPRPEQSIVVVWEF
ncbi:MAG TPA: hypothetical protein VK760_06925, partial [Candidatus Acidoferrales bacterium]|nr:hypothetical protein [Candidatus Acidoferrales bacterium]